MRWLRAVLRCAGIDTGEITDADAAEAGLIEDWELWACANQYIKHYGENAPIFAAMRADELMNEGDLDGTKTFRSIVRRINELLSPPPEILN